MRLKSIDIFRGITVALMIVVNGVDGEAAYGILLHSNWHGCSLADLVFPFFVLIVGVSAVFSLSSFRHRGTIPSYLLPPGTAVDRARLRKTVTSSTSSTSGRSERVILFKVLKRACWIFLLGLFLNAYPYHLDFSSFRLMGVLQRIAICYFIVSLLYLTTTARMQFFIFIVLLLGYWFLMTQVPVPGLDVNVLTADGNWAAFVDRLLIAPQYLYKPYFDPEGLLSTLPAVATALMGSFLGMFLLEVNRLISDPFSPRAPEESGIKIFILSRTSGRGAKAVAFIVLAGLICMALGWTWGMTFPINKALWTSSYVLWTGGMGFIVFGVCYCAVDILHWQKWLRPFELFGLSALGVFVVHVLLLKTQYIIYIHAADGHLMNLKLYIMTALSDVVSSSNASLLYGLMLAALMFVLMSCFSLTPKNVSFIEYCFSFFRIFFIERHCYISFIFEEFTLIVLKKIKKGLTLIFFIFLVHRDSFLKHTV